MDYSLTITRGLENEDPARTETIEAYRDKLIEKTGTHNSAELIMFALQNGILND